MARKFTEEELQKSKEEVRAYALQRFGKDILSPSPKSTTKSVSSALELISRPGPFRASPVELEMLLGLSLSEVRSWSPAQIRKLGSAFCIMGYDARGNILRDLATATDKDDGERFLKYLRECNP